jgi:hypothetical protein
VGYYRSPFRGFNLGEFVKFVSKTPRLCKFRRRRKDSFMAKPKGALAGNRPSPVRPGD